MAYEEIVQETVYKASREVTKYLMKGDSLTSLLKHNKIGEFLKAIEKKHLRGSGGAFRVTKEKSIEEDIDEVQKLRGVQSWDDGVCPNCQNDELEFCFICYWQFQEELQRAKNKL